MKKGIVVLVVILILLVLGMGGYLVYDKILSKDEVNNKKVEQKQPEVKESSIKIDDSKEYVYDADYTYNNNQDLNNFKSVDASQFTNGLLQNKLSIAVPYVNINTEDAKKVNTEILGVFNDRMARLEEDIKLNNESTDVPQGGIYLNYVTYYTGDYVSVVIATGNYRTSMPYSSYYGYVFNIKTGKLLTTEDIAGVKNMSVDELEQKTKTAIDKFTKEKDQESNTNSYTNLITQTYSELHESIHYQGRAGLAYESNKKGIIYFLDNNNNLKVLVDINVEMQDGKYAYLLNVQ